MTTFEHARAHIYKVTIKATEYEKATKPEIWPYRVGVRLFKQFRRQDNYQQSSWDSQVKQAMQSQHGPPLVSAPPLVLLNSPTSTGGIETSNIFNVLASGGPNGGPASDHEIFFPMCCILQFSWF